MSLGTAILYRQRLGVLRDTFSIINNNAVLKE
jgi:hypothetical protein